MNEGDKREQEHQAHQHRFEQARELMRGAGYVPADPTDPDSEWVKPEDALPDLSQMPAPNWTAFVDLLNRCKARVEDEPAAYTDNPHLYGILQRIYLRPCHGNIPDYEEPGSHA